MNIFNVITPLGQIYFNQVGIEFLIIVFINNDITEYYSTYKLHYMVLFIFRVLIRHLYERLFSHDNFFNKGNSNYRLWTVVYLSICDNFSLPK